MKLAFKIIMIILASTIFISCNKKVVKKSGKIKFTYLMVKEASTDSDEFVELDISTIYFRGENFLEVLPDYYVQQNKEAPYNIIKKGKYINSQKLSLDNFGELSKDIKTKKSGVTFYEIELEGELIPTTDTILENINFKRWVLNTKDYYSVYYVQPSDTILPFNLNQKLGKEGLLRRVDTYDRKEDIFTSLKMTVSDTLSKKEYEFLKQMENEI